VPPVQRLSISVRHRNRASSRAALAEFYSLTESSLETVGQRTQFAYRIPGSPQILTRGYVASCTQFAESNVISHDNPDQRLNWSRL